MILYFLVYSSWILFRWTGEVNRTLISDVGYQILSIFTVGSMVFAAFRSNIQGRERLVWLILALGVGFLSVGDLYFMYADLILVEVSFPSIADVFYLLFYPLALVGILAIPTKVRAAEDRTLALIDFGTVLVGAGTLTWYFFVAPLVGDGSDRLSQFVSVAYPISDVLLLAAIGLLLYRQPEGNMRSVLRYLGVGLTVYWISDLIYTELSLLGTYESGHWVDIGWSFGYLMMGLAALRFTRETRGVNSGRALSDAPRWVINALPFLALLLNVGVSLLAALSQAGPRR
ncbi:MAG: hypothetical protein HC806_09560 [Anaerolineae bacterium]|nr:hypothetical protein [Anaerolineae bacterium]